eukprot:c21468_g1_i3 orf=216-1433(-)
MSAQQDEQESKRLPILIPSHEQVLQQSRPRPPPSLFRPSDASPSSPPASKFSPLPCSSSPSLPQLATPPVNNLNSFTEVFSFVRKTPSYSPPPVVQGSAPPGSEKAGTTASTSGAQSIDQPSITPATSPGQIRNAILVSRRQQGNPVLKYIRNVRWLFADIVPDYLLGQNSCALYLSLRYHLLHPDYIYFRIRELQKSFRLRVVLCYVDVEDVIKPLNEVTKTALLHDCTLLCAWSLEECARYLETLKSYENKPPDIIQERIDHDYLSRLTSVLSTVRRVNKTDVLNLASSLGVKRLHNAFHEPFRRVPKQPQLSSVGITPSIIAAGSVEPEQKITVTTDSASENSNEQPEVSVRKALDFALAKHGRRWSSHQQNVEGNTKIKLITDDVNCEGSPNNVTLPSSIQ